LVDAGTGYRGSVGARCGPLRIPVALLGSLVGIAALVVSAPAGSASAPLPLPLPRVTLIGDSVADALASDGRAQAILGQGVDLQLQVAPCRRVAQLSCPYDGARPPNVIDLIGTLGNKLGPTAIVAVGYNDYEDQYAANIEAALAALKGAGVTRVLWPTLKTAYHSYVNMNADIFAAAEVHPELTVVDWNLYSQGHPEWFQPDGLHLAATGAEAMATLFHQALVQLGIPATATPSPPAPKPVRVTTFSLSNAVEGRSYSARLRANGGKPPYHWSALAGLPRGLKLLRTGLLVGIPSRQAGIFRMTVEVKDTSGAAAKARMTLRVRPPR
jgi:Putative Ig domain